MVKLTATLERIMFPKGVSRTSGGFTIASFKTVSVEEGKIELDEMFNNFKVKGEMPPLQVGNEYYLVIEEGERHPKFGLTYDLVFMRQNIELDVDDKKSIHSFLKVILTENQIKAIYDITDNPISLIESENIEELTKAKGIGVKTAERIISHYLSQKDYSYAYIELGKYDIPSSTIQRVVKLYNSPELAVQKVRENPYQLMSMDGYGFKKCDSLYLRIGGDVNSEMRINAFLIYMLQEEANNGNTWIKPIDLINATSEFIPQADKSFVGKILLDESNKSFYVTENKDRISLSLYQKLETLVSTEIVRILTAESSFEYDKWEDIVKDTEEEQGWSYTEQQKEAMKMMLENNVSILQGYGGTGKALANRTLIPTPNGEVKISDLKVGDYVFDRMGQPTKVLGVYPQGKLDCYEVTLADGRETYCNDEHLWTYYTSKENLKTITLRKMIDSGLTNRCGNKYKIPVAKAVEYTEKEFDVDPYVIGAFLGDGSCTSSTLTLCSDDESVVAEVSKLIGAKSYKKNHEKNFNWSFLLSDKGFNNICDYKRIYYHTKEVFEYYPEVLHLSHEKRIPKDFFYGSVEQRLSLIQGLMDTDGSIQYSDGRGNVSYSSTSLDLIKDMQYILRSVGYHSNIIIDEREGRRTSYQLNINMPNEEKYKLFRLPRRKDVALSLKDKKKHRNYNKVSIISVKKSDKKEDMTCIYVDNDEHLFLANDFIVTHNTTTLKAVLCVLESSGYLYAQCALSGKASNNLTLVTGKDGSTIHRLLNYSPMEGGFLYNKNNPLPYDIIVVDEISMVDEVLFSHLLLAIRDGAKLICLGDEQQLESIGVPILIPLLSSGAVPTMTLTEIHRQAQKSAVITDSIAIRQGKQPLKESMGVITRGELQDLTYDLVESDDDIFLHTIREFNKHIKTESILDVQILTPTRTKGKVSCSLLNNACQKIYNPHDESKEEVSIGKEDYKYTLRVGDKVINIKNDYRAEDENGMSCPIFNGNTGIIEKFDKNEDDEEYMLIDFEGIGKVRIYKSKYSSIQLAYAISIHKSQGSSIKIVIISLPFHYLLNTRQLLYTAITRTSKYCVMIATKSTMNKCIKKDDTSNKRTYLSEYIQEMYTKNKESN